MMPALSFLLQCAAAVALVGGGASLVLLPGVLMLRTRPLRRWAALRADLAFLLGILPFLFATAVVAGTAAPPLAAWLGWASDHCSTHGHHLHLCIQHSTSPRPFLAALGAFALAAMSWRAGHLLWRTLQMHRRLRTLEGISSPRAGRFPILAVPGAPQLCHAAGVLRRRVFLSSRLPEALNPDELASALRHEEAHLERRDPLARLLLGLAALICVPSFARLCLSAYQAAAEEACDAQAARGVGSGVIVAEALVKMTALQRGASSELAGVAAFGQVALERRVRLLLEGGAQPSGALWALVGAALITLAAAMALANAAPLHHAVETALSLLS